MNTIERRLLKLEGEATGRGGPHILVVMPGQTLEEVKAKYPKPIGSDDDVQILEVRFVAPETRLIRACGDAAQGVRGTGSN